MEFVALSDTVLRTLALEDPTLRRVFHGVYPADQLPRSPPGVSVKRTLSTPILRENRDSIGWLYGRKRISARFLTVMGYPCMCTPTWSCTSGGVNGST